MSKTPDMIIGTDGSFGFVGDTAPDGVKWGADCHHSAHVSLVEDVWQPCDDPKCKYRVSE